MSFLKKLFDTHDLDPQDATKYLKRGLANLEQSQLVAAVADFDQAIKLAKDDATRFAICYNRGNVHRTLGNRTLAIADYSHTIEIAPSVYGYLNRGGVYLEEGDLTAAIADFESMIRLPPSSFKNVA